jgi:hypothetical protein
MRTLRVAKGVTTGAWKRKREGQLSLGGFAVCRERNQKCHLLSPTISRLALAPALNLLKWGKGPVEKCLARLHEAEYLDTWISTGRDRSATAIFGSRMTATPGLMYPRSFTKDFLHSNMIASSTDVEAFRPRNMVGDLAHTM